MPFQMPQQQPPVGGSNFTMNEVPDLTAKLSMLPSSGLQQFAQLHKGDPYIMALVMSESNRRKKLQQAGQQPQGEPPKVVDQMISSLALPEERGIAQLPAPNMANMADGGIAGYSDDEEGYAAGGVPGYAGDGDQGQQVKEKNVEYKYVRDTLGNIVKVPVDKTDKKPGLSDMLKAVSDFSNRNAGKPPAPPAPPAPPPAPGAPAFQTPNQQGFMPGGSTPPSMAPQMAPPPPPKNTAPRPDATGTTMPGLSYAGITAQGNQNINNIESQLSKARSDFATMLPRSADADKDLEYFVQQRKAAMPEGQAYAGFEKNLQDEAAAEPAEKEKAGLLALTKGFLGMAAGESQNAMTNIAKGLGIGLEDYASSVKEFRKAGKERQKQLADIEQARRAEARGDVDAASGHMEKAQEREAHRQTALATGINNLNATGLHGLASLMNANTSGQYGLLGHKMSSDASLAAAKLHDPLRMYEAFANPESAAFKGLKNKAELESAAKADQQYALKYAGAQGAIALQMLESQGAEGKAEANRIRGILKNMGSTVPSFTDAPTGPTR
jgi:hypothetical protein